MYSSTWHLKNSHLPAPNIQQFSTRRREEEERIVFVEVEQAQQQPAETFAPTSVTNFGNHVLSNDSIEQFPTGRREEEERLFVEAERKASNC